MRFECSEVARTAYGACGSDRRPIGAWTERAPNLRGTEGVLKRTNENVLGLSRNKERVTLVSRGYTDPLGLADLARRSPPGGCICICASGGCRCALSPKSGVGDIRRHSLHHEAAGTDHPRVLRTGTPVSRGGRRVVELVGSFNSCARGGRHSIPDIFASAFGGHQSCKIRYSSSLNPSGHARANPTHTKTDTTLRR
jgi:hypothetical protein